MSSICRKMFYFLSRSCQNGHYIRFNRIQNADRTRLANVTLEFGDGWQLIWLVATCVTMVDVAVQSCSRV